MEINEEAFEDTFGQHDNSARFIARGIIKSYLNNLSQHFSSPELVERVALTLWCHQQANDGYENTSGLGVLSPEMQAFYREQAQAAIAAMGDASTRKDEVTTLGSDAKSPASPSEISVVGIDEKALMAAIEVYADRTNFYPDEMRDDMFAAISAYEHARPRTSEPVTVADGVTALMKLEDRLDADIHSHDMPKIVKAVLDAAGVRYE